MALRNCTSIHKDTLHHHKYDLHVTLV